MAAVQTNDASAQAQASYTIRPKDRHWAVIDPAGALVCLTVYKRGAVEVVQRLSN